ncbi:MAG: 6-carboxytetrahydropterin synthase [Planctomycetota bacterium]|nr:MAG: 6-carboxytetrahydropterin synthase [Planctomycetota bacterium]
MVELTRAFEFSAAHRLWSETLSDEENLRIFGKCSNPHGHGHNYVLEVTVGGTPDEVTGTLIGPPELDRVVRERVIDPFDHKNLNVEVPEFCTINPSVENIARVIWDRLVEVLGPQRLARVRVWETAKTYAEYAGDTKEESA